MIGDRINPRGLFTGAWVPLWLLSIPTVSPAAKLLYAILARHAGEDGNCFPGQQLLACEIGLDGKPESQVRTIRRYLAELEREKLIRIQQNGLNETNNYHFLEHKSMIFKDGTNLSAPDRTNLSGQDRTKMSARREEVKRSSSFLSSGAAAPGREILLENRTDKNRFAEIKAHFTSEQIDEACSKIEGRLFITAIAAALGHCFTKPSTPNRSVSLREPQGESTQEMLARVYQQHITKDSPFPDSDIIEGEFHAG